MDRLCSQSSEAVARLLCWYKVQANGNIRGVFTIHTSSPQRQYTLILISDHASTPMCCYYRSGHSVELLSKCGSSVRLRYLLRPYIYRPRRSRHSLPESLYLGYRYECSLAVCSVHFPDHQYQHPDRLRQLRRLVRFDTCRAALD